ncbi:MAG TPA: lanthionine synthetase C family protein [Labilithrix sp.]
MRDATIEDPTLAKGLAGVALVHRAFGDDARARRAIDGALRRIPPSPSLFSGFTGIAWAAHLIVGDGEDPVEAVDYALLDRLEAWSGPYDLVEGLVGVGVYALERLPRKAARRMLARVVARLDEAPPHEGERVDLGVAHGIPAVIALLGRVVAAGVDARTTKRARSLLDASVAWLLAHELPRGSFGRFASAVAPDMPRRPTRLAWCYGDAGIAASLLIAARSVRRRAWKNAATRIALAAASRTPDDSGVEDPGLCHGAFGLAHAFRRIHEATGDVRFARASRRWLDRALAMPMPRSPALLEGAGGAALALLGADSGWDRALLLS